MKDKKKVVIGALCALVMIMAVGYALLGQNLSISGTSSITSNWQVEITNIIVKEKSTGATTNNTNYTATTASFNTSLTSPGDYAIYEVTVTNKGTLDAVLAAKPTVTAGNNEAIIYELEGIAKGDKILKNNQTDTFTIKVQYNQTTTQQPSNLTSDIQVTLNYQQDLGQVSPYDGYEIGDVISFNNANWRVIKASTEDEDYVTVMKETVLTNAELGSYAYSSTADTMEFTWTATCHNANHGYTSDNKTNCDNTYNYTDSKVKEFLEETYLQTLGENNLRSIKPNDYYTNAYKIRLLTIDDLMYNLNVTRCGTSCYQIGNNTPSWVYEDIDGNHISYWLMDGYWAQYENSNSKVWIVDGNDYLHYDGVNSNSIAVRPVINLLKSAIE